MESPITFKPIHSDTECIGIINFKFEQIGINDKNDADGMARVQPMIRLLLEARRDFGINFMSTLVCPETK